MTKQYSCVGGGTRQSITVMGSAFTHPVFPSFILSMQNIGSSLPGFP